MRIVGLRLENFRSYRNTVSFDSSSPITVLIGPNNSGKSSIIQALLWYKGQSSGQSSRRWEEYLHTGNRGAPLRLHVEFELTADERDSFLTRLESRLGSGLPLRDSQFLRRVAHDLLFTNAEQLTEEVSIMNYSGAWLAVFGREIQQGGSNFWTSSFESDPAVNVNATQLAHTVTNRQSLVPLSFGWTFPPNSFEMRLGDLIRGTLSRWTPVNPVRSVNPLIPFSQETYVSADGSNVARILNNLQTSEPDFYAKVVGEMHDVVLDLGLVTAPARGGNVTVNIREPGGIVVDLQDASVGLGQTLILVTTLFTCQEKSLLLVEEPEIHLHAFSQRALFRLMRKTARERGLQVVLTTHSTIFTACDDEVRTYLVEKKSGVSTLKALREPSELRLLKHVLGHENTDLFGYKAVLIVEGDTEESALPIMADNMGYDLVEQGIKVINIRGAGKARRVYELLQFLKDSDTTVFLLLDGHAIIRNSILEWSREGLVLADHAKVLDREFEECFDDDTLTASFRDWATEEGVTTSLTVEEVAEVRRSGRSLGQFLQKTAFEQTGRNLSKVTLGERIAALLSTNTHRTHLTEPEIQLKSIIEAVSGSSASHAVNER